MVYFVTPLGIHRPFFFFLWQTPCCSQVSGQTPGPSVVSGAYLRIEACSDHHTAEVSESVLPPHNEERLVKVWVVLSEFLFLHFPSREYLWDEKKAKGKGNSQKRPLGYSHMVPFHLCLFLLLLNHLYFTVFSLCISVSHCIWMLKIKGVCIIEDVLKA